MYHWLHRFSSYFSLLLLAVGQYMWQHFIKKTINTPRLFFKVPSCRTLYPTPVSPCTSLKMLPMSQHLFFSNLIHSPTRTMCSNAHIINNKYFNLSKVMQYLSETWKIYGSILGWCRFLLWTTIRVFEICFHKLLTSSTFNWILTWFLLVGIWTKNVLC